MYVKGDAISKKKALELLRLTVDELSQNEMDKKVKSQRSLLHQLDIGLLGALMGKLGQKCISVALLNQSTNTNLEYAYFSADKKCTILICALA